MTPITWRRVRAGEYESEAGRVWRVNSAEPNYDWRWVRSSVLRPNGAYGNAGRRLTGRERTECAAKAACEEAWRRAQEGDTP